MPRPSPQNDPPSPPLSPELRQGFIEAHLAALREWGDFGIDLEAWLEHRVPALLQNTPSGEKPDFRGLYLAQGLLEGSDPAFRTLYRLHVPGLLKAGRHHGYPRHLVEEEWQALVVRLPENTGSSPLLSYQGRGSLGGFLRIILLRRLGRRAAKESLHVPIRDRILPSTAARVLEAERLRLARDLVQRTLRSMNRRERLFLHLSHGEGIPLTQAALRARLLPPDQCHLRTAASRLHRRLIKLFRDRVFRIAREELDLSPESVEGLLDSTFPEERNGKEGGDIS